MIRSEYQRFMQGLTADHISEGVCKIANLVLEDLDTLQSLSTHQGQRVKRMTALAQIHWQTLATNIEIEVDDSTNHAISITRLKNLQIGPFRGFARQEVFDLDSPLVLIYGPNGTGKSSFCEALEFGLLGSVAEAESKRFRYQDYLRNAHVNRFELPVIEAFNGQGESYPIAANEALYRFCFVEKNRIDSFSRIAAQLPAKQTELISTLFGLDSFSRFVRNFTSEINDRYIDLVGVKGQQLIQKQQVLAGSYQTVRENTEALTALSQEEAALANQYTQGMTFAELVTTLGSAEFPGAIATLDAEIQQPIAVKTGLTVAALLSQRQLIESNLSALIAKKQELAASSTGLSFKQLYTAVSALGEERRDECPACKTPIDRVANNPFELAIQELSKLSHLSQLEQERDQLSVVLSSALKVVYQSLTTVCEQFVSNPLQTFFVPHESQASQSWWRSLFNLGEDGFSAWQHLHAQIQKLEQMDAAIDQAQNERVKKQERLTKLRELEKRVTVLQTRRNSLAASIQNANEAIDNFNVANKDLIVEVEAEKAIVTRNQEISNAYSQFVSKLSRYKDNLPAQLVADLGDKVVELYNAFNRSDAKKDLLASIRLPFAQGQQIEVAFQPNPERFFDALHILSEGHIRCIGLAILMAKNLKEDCPILIFDDPVNAIDDDHRESIRRTLFEDNFFDSRQIILTCHGEEFYKDIQNLLGTERAAQSKNFTFLPQLAEHHVRVDFNCAPRNYILAAQAHMDRLEVREALAKTRQALEALTKGKVWRYVNRHGDGNLSLKLRSASAPIELRNLTDQLRSKLSKAEFNHEDKYSILEPLGMLLKKDGNSREWRYLNKGTHEEFDRAEFDRTIVSEIIVAVEQLDFAVT